MTELYIDLLAFVLVLIFALLLYYVGIYKMKKEMKNFTWDQYFKQCGIYQGTSHWTTLKSYLLKSNR